jgi:deazaflavin-dependent oxidoreductase (nitroreductase family)
VEELYTSQGCSSCPPADEFFAALVADPQVIALSLHVDYWDYIGWKDEFGNPKFTERQKAYAREAGSRMIYTPQMIVGGLDSVEGNQPHEVDAMIRKHMTVARDVNLQAMRRGDILVIRAEAGRPFDAPVRVQLVRYHPEATVELGAGTRTVRARIAEGDERDRLWEWNKQDYPGFGDYETKTDRVIPVVILEPVG